jgi:hypothetical protein
VPQRPEQINATARTAIHHPIRRVTCDLADVACYECIYPTIFLEGGERIFVASFEWLLNSDYMMRKAQRLGLQPHEGEGMSEKSLLTGRESDKTIDSVS